MLPEVLHDHTHAIYELFEPLLRGVPVTIFSDPEVRDTDGFVAAVRTRGITRLLVVPSLLQASLDLGVDPSQYLATLLARLASVSPDVDPRSLENIVVQYYLQTRAQHAAELDRLL